MQTVHDSRASPSDLVNVERLQTISREWASKVHVLSGAVDKIVQPWSATASKLALAAASGDAEQLRKQVKLVSLLIFTIYVARSTSSICVVFKTVRWIEFL